MSSVGRPRGRLFQILGPTAPEPRDSVCKAVVRTWYRAQVPEEDRRYWLSACQ